MIIDVWSWDVRMCGDVSASYHDATFLFMLGELSTGLPGTHEKYAPPVDVCSDLNDIQYVPTITYSQNLFTAFRKCLKVRAGAQRE